MDVQHFQMHTRMHGVFIGLWLLAVIHPARAPADQGDFIEEEPNDQMSTAQVLGELRARSYTVKEGNS